MSVSVRSGRQDFYPNFMGFALTQTGGDTFTTVSINTPIPRVAINGNRATVMELLWCDVESQNLILNAAVESITFGLTTGAPPSDRSVISEGNAIFNLTATFHEHTTGASILVQPLRYNFQSQDGFGFLLATDSFNAFIDSNATGVALAGNFRLYYRFVQIPVTEYIGIVQSQQQSRN